MDLNAIRKRLGQLQTTNNRTSSLWKPQPGKTQIRIVPYELNKDNPFIELFFHYNLIIVLIYHQSHLVVLTQLKSLHRNFVQVVIKKIINYHVNLKQK